MSQRTTTGVDKPYPFLQNAGQMGRLVQQHNWTATPLGDMANWPNSLCTTLGIVLHAAFPMFLFWGKELTCFYNDAFRPTLGAEGKHPAIGKPAKEVWAEIWDIIGPLIDGVMSKGESVWFEDRLVPFYRNGRLEDIYGTFSYSPAFGDDGKIHGVLVTCMETTKTVAERKRIEETEERARLSVNAAELGTFDLNMLTNELIPSERFAAIFGVKEPANRQDYLNAIHKDDLPARARAYEIAMKTGSLEYEARVVWPDQSVRWIRAKGKIVFDENGTAVKLLGVVQDITTEKAFSASLEKQVKERTEELATAHQSLLEANIYLQRIINLFKEPLQVLQPVYENGKIVDFRFRLTNQAYADYARSTPPLLQGRKVSEVFPGYFQTTSFTNVVRSFETGMPNTWELHYNTDGLDLYNRMSASRLDDEVVVHFTDFTRLKQLELALVNKIAELERSNANLEEFAHAASHDLKEPVRKILVFTGQLKHQLSAQLSENDKFIFNKVERAAERMNSLIEDLLLYSHVGQGISHMEELDLNKKISLVLDDLEVNIMQKQATVDVGELPHINGNRRQIQQLFQNLVSNALKYSRPAVPPQITIRAALSHEDGKQFHLITVADNGIGFEMEYSEKIFQIFTRLHGNKEYSGSGIGLSIVKKIVENHKGFIRAESEPGKGSRFFVYLPAG